MCALGGRIKLHQTKLRVPRASLCTHVCNILLLSGSKKCYQASAGWWKHRVNHHWTSEQYSPPLSPVLDAHSNNQAGREGASLPALLTPELIEKTWSPGPSCGPADPSIPLSPSLNSIIPPWPGVHFIKHAIMHSNSCVDKARQSTDWPHKDPKRKKKSNPNNSSRGELMCSFTYWIDPIPGKSPSFAWIWIYLSFAGPLTPRYYSVLTQRHHLLSNKQLHNSRQVQWASLTW